LIKVSHLHKHVDLYWCCRLATLEPDISVTECTQIIVA